MKTINPKLTRLKVGSLKMKEISEFIETAIDADGRVVIRDRETEDNVVLWSSEAKKLTRFLIKHFMKETV